MGISLGKSVSVVIPVFNEEKNLAPLYKEIVFTLKKLHLDYEIIFVNDGSTDSSLKEMLSVKSKDKKVRVIDFRKNFGQSAAMQAGFDIAKKELVCYIDADLQVDFAELPLFLNEINRGADAVVGWRYKRKDGFFKNLFSRSAWMFRRLLIGAQLHDYGCPFKVMKRECAAGLELYGEMHRYLPAMLRWRGYDVREVKISHKKRIHGKTKYSIGRLYKGFLDLIVVWFWQKYSFRPLHIFGGLGLIAIFLSIILTIILVGLRLDGKISLSQSPFPLFAAFMFIAGIIFFCFGIISDILVRIYYKTGRVKNYSIKRVY
ncbi:Glycosyltransferase AglD [uncultured archaeon]|nr:Glycosyltransferase AglD [uncultured archaeon]